MKTCLDQFVTPKVEQKNGITIAIYYCEKARVEFAVSYPVDKGADFGIISQAMKTIVPVCSHCNLCDFQNCSMDNM